MQLVKCGMSRVPGEENRGAWFSLVTQRRSPRKRLERRQAKSRGKAVGRERSP